jgi:cytochrome P450 family 6
VSSKYTVPGTEIVFPVNTTVTIPVYAIHHDETIYPNPEVYDPERFSPENVKQRHQYAFLPFGEGPRNCIGLRFGMMQARIGLAMLLNNYTFSTCSKTVVPLEFKVESFVLSPKNGLWLNVEKI